MTVLALSGGAGAFAASRPGHPGSRGAGVAPVMIVIMGEGTRISGLDAIIAEHLNMPDQHGFYPDLPVFKMFSGGKTR
jgi:hypothetical protein